MNHFRSIDSSGPSLPCRADVMAWKAASPGEGLLLIILPLVLLSRRQSLPPWAFMWLIAFGIFFGCKYLTWNRARIGASTWRLVAYFLAWPGMDARAFLSSTSPMTGPERSVHRWLAALAKTVLGIVLILIAIGEARGTDSLLVGWAG